MMPTPGARTKICAEPQLLCQKCCAAGVHYGGGRSQQREAKEVLLIRLFGVLLFLKS